jgi:predicted CXXCH cytochrome family protein
MRTIVWVAILALLAPDLGAKGGGVFRGTKHGDRTVGPQRIPERPRGSCTQCHEPHSGRDGNASGGPHEKALFAPNDNALCLTCHDRRSANGLFPGSVRWTQGGHALAASMYWPGPKARPSSDSGKCVNCHDPHGTRDTTGSPVASLLVAQDDDLCITCHSGARARDVRTQFTKAYHHPIELRGRHAAGEGADSSSFSATGNQRHSECADCHNPHELRDGRGMTSAPEASERIAGVSRIQVTNSSAGMRPIYTWRGPDDRAFAAEYEVCFKCHSSWTRQPPGQSDLAALTNPANPSYHPIQARGANEKINPLAFAYGWTDRSTVYCTDCHGSDDPQARGPHGSVYESILKRPYTASPLQRAMSPDEICFNCHSFEVYADPGAPEIVQRASRFNGPQTSGHTFHVGVQQTPCYTCHETHGSTRYSALIVTGRLPGINSYTQTTAGGSCTATCHVTRNYSVNYTR